MPKSHKKKQIQIIYIVDGETRSGECWIPVGGPNPMASVIGDLELIAEGYRVEVTTKS